jgi:hypothetical protein
VFAAPFGDELIVEVHRGGGGPLANAKVTLDAAGADVSNSDGHGESETATAVSDAAGRVAFVITPRAHAVEANVIATSGALTGSWSGLLPIVPGALWLDPRPSASHVLSVVSPVVRSTAYLSIVTATERPFGATLALMPDAQGFARGSIELPPWTSDLDPAWAVLSSDPVSASAGTIGWPLSTQQDPFRTEARVVRDDLLLDGYASALESDVRRILHARLLAGAGLFAAALLEALLLTRASRTSSALDAELERLEEVPRRNRLKPAFALAIAIAVVILSFAILGIVAMWKMGT